MSKKNKRLHLLRSCMDQIEKLPWYIVGNKKPVIVQNVFICPICLKVIDLNEVSENELNNIVSLEDVPPKSMGGTPILITCKSCNNTCGHNMDVFLLNELKYREDIKSFGNKGKRAKLTSGEYDVNAIVKLKEDKTLVLEVKKENDPKKIKSYFETIQSECDWKLNAHIILSDVKRNQAAANIALLKSAYLLAFQKLGYRYILTTKLDVVRNQIQNPEESLIPKFIVGDERYIKEEYEDGVYRAYYNETEILLVIFSYRFNDIRNRRAIALPSINTDVDIYEVIKQQTYFSISIIEEIPELKEYAIK